MRKKAIRKEEVERTSIHHALTVRRRIIQKIFAGSGLELNVGPAISLVMWRRYAKIKQTSRGSQLKLLSITNRRRRSCLLFNKQKQRRMTN